MIDRLLDTIAPHICCYCGQQNAILCDNCYFDIIEDQFGQCIQCLNPAISSNLCDGCRTSTGIQDVWVVGARTEALKALIDAYKFDRVQQGATVIASLLHDRLPILPDDAIICYIPDISAHRRQRGYDHMAEIARQLGKRRSMKVPNLLKRNTHVSQRDLTRKERLTSQVDAFLVNSHPPRTVIVLDDIYTTGATLQAATTALMTAGVETIYAAIVARQPLDETHDL